MSRGPKRRTCDSKERHSPKNTNMANRKGKAEKDQHSFICFIYKWSPLAFISISKDASFG